MYWALFFYGLVHQVRLHFSVKSVITSMYLIALFLRIVAPEEKGTQPRIYYRKRSTEVTPISARLSREDEVGGRVFRQIWARR